jgi:hypothetical protein
MPKAGQRQYPISASDLLDDNLLNLQRDQDAVL